MSDREDLARIIAIENGDGQRGPFEADYAAADAIIAAGWVKPPPFKSVDCPIHGHEARFGAAVDDVHVEQPIRTWGGHIISAGEST